MEKLILLGSSGSIGEQALDVAERYNIKVEALSVNTSIQKLEEAVRRFSPSFAAVTDKALAEDARVRLADTSVRLFFGDDAIPEMLTYTEGDTVLNAIVGEAGLRPTVAAIENRKRLALANKESLVVAGELVMRLAKEKNVEILPVDSEHCALHQCLKSAPFENAEELILTASGGPFFGYSKDKLKNVTLEETLNHPTWNMGKKITVDSATLMNKGFEIIEAAHLFDFPIEKISAVVHRESIIHSMVRFSDNTVTAQLSNPDMRSCISYALFYPERRFVGTPRLDFAKLGSLSFFEVDTDAFPLINAARVAFSRGGVIPAVLNAANEEAVAAFLDRRIDFTDIQDIVCDFVHNYNNIKNPTLNEIFEISEGVRREVRTALTLS